MDIDIYSMKLHETVITTTDDIKREIEITRVPGGWIYARPALSTSVFVPFDNEFQRKA